MEDGDQAAAEDGDPDAVGHFHRDCDGVDRSHQSWFLNSVQCCHLPQCQRPLWILSHRGGIDAVPSLHWWHQIRT